MNDQNLTEATQTTGERAADQQADTATLDWETPRLEDVSEQVMAQPYIRFT